MPRPRLSPQPTDEDIEDFLKAVCGTKEKYDEAISRLRSAGALKSFLHDIGGSPEKFSVLRAIKTAITANGRPTGYEGEVSRQIADLLPSGTVKGFAVPLYCLAAKTVNATTFGQGGALALENVFDPFEALRAKAVVTQAGARIFNATGKVLIPRFLTGATAQWLSEIGAITESDPTFEALTLSAHRIGAMTRITNELLTQTGGAAEDWVRNDLMNAVATAIDAGALKGAGGVEPLGLGTSTEPQGITFGGAATYDDAVEMEYLIAEANAPDDNISFIASPAVRKKWRLTQRSAGESVRLWDHDNRIVGRPAFATKNAPGNRMICGAFNHYAIAMFGVVDVLVNPFNEDYRGVTRVVINAWADCGEIIPQSFVVSTDDANQ